MAIKFSTDRDVNTEDGKRLLRNDVDEVIERFNDYLVGQLGQDKMMRLEETLIKEFIHVAVRGKLDGEETSAPDPTGAVQ